MRAVLLDLDGTLVDSLPDLACALNGALAEQGRRSLDLVEVRRMVGDGAPVLVARALAATGGVEDLDGALARFLDRYLGAEAVHTRPYPGASDALATLVAAGARLALVTNKPEAPARAILQTFGWEGHFDVVIGGDTLPLRKPHPAPAYAALRALGDPAAVFVGDSAVDAATARAAGLPLVLVSYGYSDAPPTSLGADRVVDHAADIAGAALELLGGR